jgi:hypothetical protein
LEACTALFAAAVLEAEALFSEICALLADAAALFL